MTFYAKELYIKKFRKIENQTISFGRRLNVISGQNGVGKSNIMALVVATFGKKTNRFSSGNFHPKYNDFFTISENENFRDYESHLKVESSCSKVIISKRQSFKNDTEENRNIRLIPRNSTYFYKENYTQEKVKEIIKKEYNIGPDARIPIPAIISTLSRLYPVGETEITNKVLRKKYSSEVKDKYSEYYNIVFPASINNNSSINIIHKSITKKNTLYIDLNNATKETQSVGQDSLSSIITALTDFYHLKISDPDNYEGGILCIDELDSSLHPKAQINLINLLVETAEDLNLQIFITTHSLTIIKQIIKLERESSKDYKLIYLLDPEFPRVHNYSSYTELKSDLFDEINVYKPIVKIYCEDEYTEFISKELEKSCKKILNKSLPEYKIIPIHLGCTNLLKLPSQDSYFGKTVIVLDGDARLKDKQNLLYEYINKLSLSDKNSKKISANFIYLPSFLAPESYIYFLLNTITNNSIYHSYWANLNNTEFSILTKSKLNHILLNQVNITRDTKNDELKKLFTNNNSLDIKDLIVKTQLFDFYYQNNQKELEKYYNYVQEAINKTSKYIKSENY